MPILRSLRLAAVLAAATGFMSLSGCDTATGKADKQARQNIEEAIPGINGSEDDRRKADALLASAWGQIDASPVERINIQELRGQLELRNAQELQPKINADQTDVRRLVWEINLLAAQVQMSNQLADALSKYDPSELQANLNKSVTDIQGTADHPEWIKTGSGSVPSLAGVTAQIATLQGQITDLQNGVKSLNDQRNTLLAQADQFSQDSEKAKGQNAVDLFKQGADARKKSEELSVQIDEDNVKLARAQVDLDVAQGQANVLTAAIKEMSGKADQTASVWKTIQEQIENQRSQAKALLGDASQNSVDPADPTGGASIASKSALLEAKLKSLRGLQEDAEAHLGSAIDFFKGAADLAMTLQSTLQMQISDPKNINRPDTAAWKDEAVTMHPARFNLEQAGALDRRAELSTARAADAAAVLKTAAILKPLADEAQQTLAPVLLDTDNKLANDVKTGRQVADASYDAANSLLDDITDGSASDDQRTAARVASIFTQYGWYLLSSSVGDKGASAHLDKAKAQRDEIVKNGGVVKNLPSELAVAPTPPAPPAAAH